MSDEILKHCYKCGQDKPLSEFHKHRGKKHNRSNSCKQCALEFQKAYRTKNKDKWRKAVRNSVLLKKYGITTKQYEQMLFSQNNCCALCHMPIGTSEPTDGLRPVVDHDHTTGKVRGILHAKCNSMIGLANDNVQVLYSAISYLSKAA